ncbi:MAG: cytochrome d ubiquinol oxidase subunit II [Vulcanimicrobiaceae bacterium]
MSAEHAASSLALAGIVLYAIFGGADFGGGLWDFFASGPQRIEQRKAIGAAMGPVWETNHIWLIFSLVALFTCFPPVFAQLSIHLYLPLTLALIGIILRGAAFAFLGPATRDLWVNQIWGKIFGIASLFTPFFFGACAAGVATGTFHWMGLFGICVGLFAVALCAQVAAIFLAAETRGELDQDFSKRAIVATFCVAAIGLLALFAAGRGNVHMFDRLMNTWPAIGIAMLAGVLILGLLRTRHYRTARVAAGIEITAVLGGWFIAQGPLLSHDLGLASIAATPATIAIFLWIAAAGSIVLLPSLWLLFAVFKRQPIQRL